MNLVSKAHISDHSRVKLVASHKLTQRGINTLYSVVCNAARGWVAMLNDQNHKVSIDIGISFYRSGVIDFMSMILDRIPEAFHDICYFVFGIAFMLALHLAEICQNHISARTTSNLHEELYRYFFARSNCWPTGQPCGRFRG